MHMVIQLRSGLFWFSHLFDFYLFFFMLSDSWYLKVGELIVNSHFFFFPFFFMLSDSWYLKVGESIVNSLNLYTKVEGGFASVKDVTTMQLEDHQHSFFLAET